MSTKSTHIAVGVVAALLIATGAVYILVTVQQIGEAKAEFEDEESKKLSEFDSAAYVETAFFAGVGGSYIPIGIWTMHSRNNNRTPYYIAIVGSISLIGLYVLSRTIDLPLVGLQDDVGFIDIFSKILQGGIIATSVFVIATIRKDKKAKLLA